MVRQCESGGIREMARTNAHAVISYHMDMYRAEFMARLRGLHKPLVRLRPNVSNIATNPSTTFDGKPVVLVSSGRVMSRGQQTIRLIVDARRCVRITRIFRARRGFIITSIQCHSTELFAIPSGLASEYMDTRTLQIDCPTLPPYATFDFTVINQRTEAARFYVHLEYDALDIESNQKLV